MEPGTICLYGRTGIGKTIDANRCFPNALVLQTERGALTSVQSFLGREPPHVDLFSVDEPYYEMEKALRGPVQKAIKELGVNTVIMDTASEWADRVLTAGVDEVGKDARQLYPHVGRLVKTILRRLLAMKVWVVVICHEAEPKTIEGRFTRGGPALPGKLVESTPALFDTILRATIGVDGTDSAGELGLGDSEEKAKVGVRRVYRCDELDSRWVGKDRFCVAREEQPMDLRVLMYQIIKRELPPDEVLRGWGHDPGDWR